MTIIIEEPQPPRKWKLMLVPSDRGDSREADADDLLKAGFVRAESTRYTAQQFADAALVALAGAGICTPEKGFMADGGPGEMASCIERLMRRNVENARRWQAQVRELEATLERVREVQRKARLEMERPGAGPAAYADGKIAAYNQIDSWIQQALGTADSPNDTTMAAQVRELEATLERVREECDRISDVVTRQTISGLLHPQTAGGMTAAVRRVRAALGTADSPNDTPMAAQPPVALAHDPLLPALVAWLRWHAPTQEELRQAPAECRPLLEAMSQVECSQAISRLATSLYVAPERERLRDAVDALRKHEEGSRGDE